MRTKTKPAQLDAIDVAILEVLQTDGRLSNLDLAQRVPLLAQPAAQILVAHGPHAHDLAHVTQLLHPPDEHAHTFGGLVAQGMQKTLADFRGRVTPNPVSTP